MLGRVITAVVFTLAVGATASARDHLKPGQTFVPPPRTIADLKALIGELPEVPDADTCAAKQAWRAKNLTLTIDRIRRAKSKSARDGAASSLVVASESEFVRGNFRATTKMIKRAIHFLPTPWNSTRKAVFHALLASVYGSIGAAPNRSRPGIVERH